LSTKKGGLYYLLFAEYGIYFVALKLSGAIASTKEFAELFVRDPSMFYLMGRATTALFGSATVLAVYALARQVYRAPAALLAAIFLAVNVLHVDLSHRVNVDVLMTLLAVVSLYFAMRITTDGMRRDYLLAALFAGLAATTKITAILLSCRS
jgi:dolichyl-phosphate-mannose--protein O-mannosyl transferase